MSQIEEEFISGFAEPVTEHRQYAVNTLQKTAKGIWSLWTAPTQSVFIMEPAKYIKKPID